MTRPPSALVTGASRGLGRAIASSLAGDGWALVVDARHADDLASAVAGLPATEPVEARPGDVTDPGHREELAEAAARLGGLDLLVLSAGALGPTPLPRLEALDLDDLRRTLEVNLVAQLGLVQALLPHLHDDATVVAITSDAAVEAYEGWGAYGASKAALEQMAAVLAAEQPGLRVLRVDPGDLRTQMHQDAFPGEDISDRPVPEQAVPPLRALLAAPTPSGRYRLAEVASALEVGA